MYIILLFIYLLEISGEWVEISQQHYRKPVNHKILKPKIKHIEESKYSNESIVDYNWTDDTHRKPSTNNIKLSNFPANNLHQFTTETFSIETVDTSEASDELGFTEEIPFANKEYGVIERVPNVGSIHRVHLTKSPVRSPSLRHSGINTKENSPIRIQTTPKKNNPDIIKNKTNIEAVRIDNVENLSKPINGKVSLMKTKPSSSSYESPFNGFRKSSQIHPITAIYNRDQREKHHNNQNFITAKERNHIEGNLNRKESYGPNITNFNKNNIPDVQNELTTKAANNLELNANIILEDENLSKSNNFPKEHFKSNTNRTEAGSDKINDIKANALTNVMKFMKVVADTISKNTRQNVGSKVQYLEDLKETILDNIADRIDTTWPDDEPRIPSRRQSRSTASTARGHVDFPSSESSLMTISFLTFAVFLIKLILQVIQTYKAKATMIAPLVVATGGRAALKKIRDRKNLNNPDP